MESYLLDTNIASFLLDKNSKFYKIAIKFAQSLNPNDRIFISRIVVAEIKYGHKVFKVFLYSDIKRRQAIENAFKTYRVLEISKHTTDPYSDIRSALFLKYARQDRKGKIKDTKFPEKLVDRTTSFELGIQENDIWIAAIALEYNAILVTADKHFSRIKELIPDLRIKLWK